MLFVDEPYLSDFLKITLSENDLPVVNTEMAKKFSFYTGTNFLSEEQVVKQVRESSNLLIYTTSENSIGWIAKHLAFSDYPQKIELFKNKAKFRRLTQSLYPNFFFKEVSVKDLQKVVLQELPSPFIIKPTVGFFSMGVHKVSNAADWKATVDAINAEIEKITGLYPDEVLNIDSFIIE